MSLLVRRRYQEVLALLNEGEGLERWILGEFVRLTVERAQAIATADLGSPLEEFRADIVCAAEESGFRLAEPSSPPAVAASASSPHASTDPVVVCGPAHQQHTDSTSPLTAPHAGVATGGDEDQPNEGST